MTGQILLNTILGCIVLISILLGILKPRIFTGKGSELGGFLITGSLISIVIFTIEIIYYIIIYWDKPIF